MLSQDFYGKKGFIWWIGVVEDIYDPLELGGARVRIIGLHSEDTSLVPTESLPWAQQLKPSTGSNTYSSLNVADWVFGFFQDGEYAQIPVIMGVFSGIEGAQSTTIYQTWVASQGGYVPKQPNYSGSYDPAFLEDEYGNDAKAVENADSEISVTGQPAVSPAFRGVKPKVMAAASNKRKHICDISPFVKKAVSHVNGLFGIVVEGLRQVVLAVIKALGFDPTGIASFLKEIAAYITDFIQKIRKVLKLIRDGINKIKELVTLFTTVIRYILSLPERAKKFLIGCLNDIVDAIKAGFANILVPSLFGPGSLKDEYNKIKNELKALQRESMLVTQDLISVAGAVGTVVSLVNKPKYNQAQINTITGDAQLAKSVDETQKKVDSKDPTQSETQIQGQYGDLMYLPPALVKSIMSPTSEEEILSSQKLTNGYVNALTKTSTTMTSRNNYNNSVLW